MDEHGKIAAICPFEPLPKSASTDKAHIERLIAYLLILSGAGGNATKKMGGRMFKVGKDGSWFGVVLTPGGFTGFVGRYRMDVSYGY